MTAGSVLAFCWVPGRTQGFDFDLYYSDYCGSYLPETSPVLSDVRSGWQECLHSGVLRGV